MIMATTMIAMTITANGTPTAIPMMAPCPSPGLTTSPEGAVWPEGGTTRLTGVLTTTSVGATDVCVVGGATAATPVAAAVVFKALLSVELIVLKSADWRDEAANDGEIDVKGATGAAVGSTGAATPEVAALKVISKIKLNVERFFAELSMITTMVILEASKLRSWASWVLRASSSVEEGMSSTTARSSTTIC